MDLPPKIILFDGVCHLCTASIQFIIKRDSNSLFKFAYLQSSIGQALCKQLNIPTDNLSTLVYIENKENNGNVISQYSYYKSDAVLQIGIKLGWPWKFGLFCLIVPKPIRDRIYDFIAKHRYQWFGKSQECWMPTDDLKQRFLGKPPSLGKSD